MCWSALVCVGVGWYVLGWWSVLAWVGMYCCWLVCVRMYSCVLECVCMCFFASYVLVWVGMYRNVLICYGM